MLAKVQQDLKSSHNTLLDGIELLSRRGEEPVTSTPQRTAVMHESLITPLHAQRTDRIISVLLCIERINGTKSLEEVDLSSVHSGGELFRRLANAFEKHRSRAWNMGLFTGLCNTRFVEVCYLDSISSYAES